MSKKMSKKLEDLLLRLRSLPIVGIDTPMEEVLRSFLRGELDLYDAETGEKISPADYESECRGLTVNGIEILPVGD